VLDFFTIRHHLGLRGAFWHIAYVQCILHGIHQCLPLCSIYFCWRWKLLIQWLHMMTSSLQLKIFCIFHTGYFDYTFYFQVLLNLYWLITDWTQLAMKRNGYFAFKMIINILGVQLLRCSLHGFTTVKMILRKLLL